jgi:hypothetical protein
MKKLLTCLMLYGLTACAGAQVLAPASPAAANALTVDKKPSQATQRSTEDIGDIPVSRAIALAQEARLQEQLAPIRAKVLEGSSLPLDQATTGFKIVIGVRGNVADDWTRRTDEEIRRRIDSPEFRDTELKGVADFVQAEVYKRVHGIPMPILEGGLVPQEAVSKRVTAYLSILDQVKTSSEFRITITVITVPKEATFDLCREYVPSDCTSVGTNVTLADIFRGRYIYKITRKGYHKIQAPLNLVNFTQSRLWCPLHADSESADGVPCTPQ